MGETVGSLSLWSTLQVVSLARWIVWKEQTDNCQHGGLATCGTWGTFDVQSGKDTDC